MGNGPPNGEQNPNEEYAEDGFFKKTSLLNGLNRKQDANDLIFFAATDKARVIAEILEERGWSRTKDNNVTNFTIKWCLANQVDWNQFQEGKQLINNIPGQLAFSDKINLWYTIRDYLCNRRSLDGNHIQTFLPMTFVLDDENEVAGFLRAYKKQARTWICKPRYNYAGRGIYILSGSSDLNTIFKFKVGNNNRLQYEPKLSGYLMQEYISRPLLIKSRKFDIRVHWLVAWTKPLLVFYNHNASVVRLSLNLYREFDYDRATHLTNLSVQENHCRYACEHESTGMTMSQLNHYFNQCFRPFQPKMCQNWVMTVMQDRMQTIIRHVIRASKDKLTRGAGQFGLFGCDFLLDEHFRIWLLEINDNPGVGWGNPRLNISTKPLFEETLNIVFECFEKYNNGQPILPIECLQNYKLIYNEDDDADKLLRDDNQIFTEYLSIKYAKKEFPPRTARRMLPRVHTSRTSFTQNDNTIDINNNNNNNNTNSKNNDAILPSINMTNSNSPIIDMVSSNSPIINTTSVNHPLRTTPSLNLPMRATTPVSLSLIDARPLNPSMISSTPDSFSLFNRKPLDPSTVSSTPTCLSSLDTRPLNPSIVSSTPTCLSSLDTRPLNNPSIVSSTSVMFPTIVTTPFNSITVNTTDDKNESFQHDDDIELERLMKQKQPIIISKSKPLVSTVSTIIRPSIKTNKTSIKRTLSVATTLGIQRKKRIDLTPILIDNRRYTYRPGITPPCTETTPSATTRKDKLLKTKNIFNDDKEEKTDEQDNQSIIRASTNLNLPEFVSFN